MSRPADISYPTICSEDTLSIRILSSSSDCRSLDIFSMTIVPFAVFVENTLMMFGWQSGISLSRNKPGGGGGGGGGGMSKAHLACLEHFHTSP